MSTPQRLAKAIAHAGICSRREAEVLIRDGKVEVDGALITTPAFTVTDANQIKVNGKLLAAVEAARLWLFHKPDGYITTSKDPQGRPTIFSLLPKDMPRVITIGRLDLTTEGLLLLTNNGDLARHLELPATGWVRRYRVRAFGRVQSRQLAAIQRGVTIDGIRYRPAEISVESSRGNNSWFSVAITEGKNREVRKLFDYMGLKVNRLIRTGFGPFELGNLPLGAVKEVAEKVVRGLNV